MQYIENEIKQCESEMRTATKERYSYLYAVQQALKWALDPVGYAAPVATVLAGKIGTMDTPVDSEGCSGALRPQQS
jgi:hypothetical protein